MANLDPRGMVGRVYEGDHLTLLNTKYPNSGPHGFREEDFLGFSHYKSMRGNELVCVCVEVLRPSQPNGVMSSVVILPHIYWAGFVL